MSLTMREQVLAAFKTALDEVATAIPGTAVERNRDIEVTSFPSVVMIDGGHALSHDTSDAQRYVLGIDVEGYVEASTFAALGPAISALYGAIVQAACVDLQLGGLAVDLEEGDMTDPEISRSEGQGCTAAFSVAFSVEYWTAVGDPFTQATL